MFVQPELAKHHKLERMILGKCLAESLGREIQPTSSLPLKFLAEALRMS
jgi:hypothetical protein